MTNLPLEQSETPDIYSFGFDKSLYREIQASSSDRNPLIYHAVEDVIAPMFASQNRVVISGSSSLQSESYQPGVRGWKIGASGVLEVGSVNFNRETVFTFFDSLDGFSQVVSSGASLIVRLGSLRFATGAGASQQSGIYNDNLSILPLKPLLKNSYFQTVLHIPLLTGDPYIADFGVGDLTSGDSGTMRGYGFKVYNDVVTGFYIDGTTQSTVQITNISVNQPNVYLAENDVNKKEIRYHVNGELKTVINTNYGTGQPETRFTYRIRNTGTITREMYVNNALFAQDR